MILTTVRTPTDDGTIITYRLDLSEDDARLLNHFVRCSMDICSIRKAVVRFVETLDDRLQDAGWPI